MTDIIAKNHAAAPSRRKIIKSLGLVGGTLIAAPAIWTSANAQAKRIVVRDAGGPFTKGFGEAFYEPFKKATGIEVVGVASGAEPTSQIKSMVETKSYTWDMVGAVSMAAVVQLTKEGDYFEKLGIDNDPLVKEIPAEYRNDYAVGSDVYSTVLAYRADKFKDRKPTSWADLWNVKELPGRRGLRKYPFDTIEEALFADGVPSDKVYPCDFDRAFKKLDQLKPHVSAWWTSGQQAVQLLVSGEVDMIPTWIARAQAAADQGAPVEIMWDQNLWGLDVWAILKGTPKADLCREFIKFCCSGERQAAFTPHLVNGPTNPNAYKFIDPARAKILPTYPDNKAKSVRIDDAFWAKNKEAAIERFNSWVLT